ncbi:MAG: orotate phosphoribosyltransferase [Alphaproteobacteria bacterium]|nr:orotate phosphoribosyltransferase [Alphaproteobacteria bacterium]
MNFGATFPDRELIQQVTSRILLEVGAVNFSATTPFIFTSGWASPVYIDCRRLIFYPRVRETLCEFATSTILREVGFEAIDVIAGGETAGIPFAAWIADRLMLPMQYVRKKPKGFGRNAQIEGDVRENARTLLVEDLTTDGRSKVNFCRALRQAGAIVEHAFVIFHYGIFPQSEQLMAEIGVKLHSLANWWDVLKVAKVEGRFDAPTMREVEKFLNDPVGWSASHGGASELPSA